MTRLERKLCARAEKGKPPYAYDVYNESNFGDCCLTLTTCGNTGWDCCGTVLLFVEAEDA